MIDENPRGNQSRVSGEDAVIHQPRQAGDAFKEAPNTLQHPETPEDPNGHSAEGELVELMFASRETGKDAQPHTAVELISLRQEVEALKRELATKDQQVQSLSRELAEKEAQFTALAGLLGTLVSSRLLSPLYSFYLRIRYPYLLKLSRFLRLTPRAQCAAGDGKFVAPDEVQTLQKLQRHTVSTDIVVCVHNALEDVRRCLESVISDTTKPYALILVDDGSDEECRQYLSEFAGKHQATLIRNESALGYTFAANQGMRKSQAAYVVLLNSDTVVSEGWLDRMTACGEADARVGLVGPVSNAATWQSIPEIIVDGEFAENKLPGNLAVADMGRMVAQYSARLHPRVPFLNGFCMMIKRAVIDAIGYFDEETFGSGYGEENDYGLRALDAGWQLVVAEDAYVYHAQSRSYSHERRKELSKQAGKALITKHGQQTVNQGVDICRYDRVLEGIRARSRVMVMREQLIEEGRARWKGRKILFILPIAFAGGGGNIVLDEAEAMQRMDVEVTILNLSQNRYGFQKGYPDCSLRTIYVKKSSDIEKLLPTYDAVIATWCESVSWLGKAGSLNGRSTRGYYVQGFEPFLFPADSAEYRMARDSYRRFPDLIRITKTEWNRRMVKENIGVDCKLVGPSVNIDLYRPRRRRDPDWPQRPLRIAAMIRPNTPCRAPLLTLEVLREVSRAHGGSIEIVLFGCQENVLAALAFKNDFPYHHVGTLSRRRVASLLNEVDIFVDFSSWQTMGLTAMEAMCCGAAVIVPQTGGAGTFVTHEHNGLLVDTTSKAACTSALNRLVIDTEFRKQLQRRAIVDICQFFRERAALNTLNAILEKPASSSK